MPLAVRLELPDWILPALAVAVRRPIWSRRCEPWLDPAPLDLRVNLLKATREAAQAALAAEGIEAAPTPISPWGLRTTAGGRSRRGSVPEGLVEIQDEGSQLVAAWSGHGRKCEWRISPGRAARRWRWR